MATFLKRRLFAQEAESVARRQRCLMRIRPASLTILFGLLFLVVGGIQYLLARSSQSEQQAVQDQEWNAEVMHYADQTPPVLPPNPPPPVPLPHRNLILGLVAAGQALLACGGLGLLISPRRK